MANNPTLTGVGSPLSYSGVSSPKPPNLIAKTVSPTSGVKNVDIRNFNLGDIWLNSSSNLPFMLTNMSGQVPTWTQLASSSGSGASNFITDSGTATQVGGNLDVNGGDLINTTGSGSTVKVNLNRGTNGQIIIASTGAASMYGSLTSSGGTITVTGGANTLNIDTASVVPISFPTDSGTATPSAGALTVAGGHGINTSGAAATVTVKINNTVTLGDLSVRTTGQDSLTLTSGNLTLSGTGVNAAGNISLPSTTSDGRQGEIQFGGSRFINNFGTNNVFIGSNAGNLALTVVSAIQNVGVGRVTLAALTTGLNNVAIGDAAATSLTSGSRNFALGSGALGLGTTALGNFAMGTANLASLTTGQNNIAIGNTTLSNLVTGSNNIVIGQTGNNYTGSETDNILINNGSLEVVGTSNVIRIGSGTGSGAGQQNKCFISGIRGITTGQADAIAVLVDSANQLGTVSSSERYKYNIEDMSDQSSIVMKLRPVTFNYKKHPNIPAWGLIAEEVDKVFPQLVVYNDQGQPETVKYHDMSILLLNELQRLEKRVSELEKKCRCN